MSPLTSQLRRGVRKVTIKYIGPLVIYKIVDPHNYLLMTLDGKILRGLFEFERLKPVTLRTSHGNVCTLVQLKQVLNLGFCPIEMEILWPLLEIERDLRSAKVWKFKISYLF